MTSFLGVVEPAQARIHQLEGSLLQQLQDTSRRTLQQAEATGVNAKLDALLASNLLAAATAGQPPGSGSSGGSSLLLEELAGGNNQVCESMEHTYEHPAFSGHSQGKEGPHSFLQGQ
jgi:hypothetical protein